MYKKEIDTISHIIAIILISIITHINTTQWQRGPPSWPWKPRSSFLSVTEQRRWQWCSGWEVPALASLSCSVYHGSCWSRQNHFIGFFEVGVDEGSEDEIVVAYLCLLILIAILGLRSYLHVCLSLYSLYSFFSFDSFSFFSFFIFFILFIDLSHIFTYHQLCSVLFIPFNSILSYIVCRKSNVAASEAGGITQKLSAFSVNIRDRWVREMEWEYGLMFQ